jgi:hypothetical protein
MVAGEQRRRLKKADWHQRAVERWKGLFEGTTSLWKFPPLSKPWQSRAGLVINPGGEREETDSENLRMARETLSNNEEFDLVVYTDGSAVEGNKDGGAGVVVTSGSVDYPVVLDKVNVAAGRWCSSFQAELVGLKEAIRWLTRHIEEWSSVRIASDSQSTLMAWNSVRYNSKNSLLYEVDCGAKFLLEKGKRMEVT